MEGLARRAAALCRALHYCRRSPGHWPRPDRDDYRRILHDDFWPGLHDHPLRQCLRNGQDLRAGDRADGAWRIAHIFIEMGGAADCALERRKPVVTKALKMEEATVAGGSNHCNRLKPISRAAER